MPIKGIYENGAIRLLEKVDLKEHQEVSIYFSEEKVFVKATEEEAKRRQDELEELSKEIEGYWYGRNRNKLTTQKEIDDNCF